MKFIESATDMECAMNITDHILHPCFFLKDSKEYQGLRQTYVSMAENLVMPSLTNPFAKEYLENIIEKYKTNPSSKSN